MDPTQLLRRKKRDGLTDAAAQAEFNEKRWVNSVYDVRVCTDGLLFNCLSLYPTFYGRLNLCPSIWIVSRSLNDKPESPPPSPHRTTQRLLTFRQVGGYGCLMPRMAFSQDG